MVKFVSEKIRKKSGESALKYRKKHHLMILHHHFNPLVIQIRIL